MARTFLEQSLSSLFRFMSCQVDGTVVHFHWISLSNKSASFIFFKMTILLEIGCFLYYGTLLLTLSSLRCLGFYSPAWNYYLMHGTCRFSTTTLSRQTHDGPCESPSKPDESHTTNPFDRKHASKTTHGTSFMDSLLDLVV